MYGRLLCLCFKTDFISNYHTLLELCQLSEYRYCSFCESTDSAMAHTS